MTTPCRSCGARNRPTARYCDQCGVPLDRAEDEATRRVVTVVFGDLVGSTALQENLDPETAAAVMARYYETMRRSVFRHGGRVEKLVGDGVVAVFGTRRVEEDDALRAVRCAHTMVSDLAVLGAELDRTWGVRLRMRVAVNTGEVVVAEGRELVGDTMNTAARLEQAAHPGGVLCGEATWRLVRHHVRLEPLAPLRVRGKAAPVRAWRLSSLEPAPDGHPEPPEAPLVGREDALHRLDSALETVTRLGGAGLVAVIGSPGVGKTRLLREFAANAAPWASVISMRCSPSGIGCRSVDEMVEQFQRLAEGPRGGGPGVLVLDDLHLAEKPVVDLLWQVTRAANAAPVLTVVAGRPSLRDRCEPLSISGHGPVEVIELAALEPDDGRRLVGELLGPSVLPISMLDRMVTMSEGNPLFVTELVRMLVDDEVLIRSARGWTCPAGLEDLPVPPTIHQLVRARLERLHPAERLVLERAAVIGKVFTATGLRELMGPDRADGLDEQLRTLTRRELIEPHPTIADGGVHHFRSEVIRDCAYGLLLKQVRADLHLRYGRWVSRQDADGRYAGEARRHFQLALGYRRQLRNRPVSSVSGCPQPGGDLRHPPVRAHHLGAQGGEPPPAPDVGGTETQRGPVADRRAQVVHGHADQRRRPGRG